MLDPNVTGNGVTGTRELDNKDGGTCNPVAYTFQNQLTVNNSVHALWSTSTQPAAVFNYTIDWKPSALDPVTGRPKVTKAAWQAGSSGKPIYFPALSCLSSLRPMQYAALSADINNSVTGFTVTITGPATVPAAPFPIVVGTERMQVNSTGTDGLTWTVTRGTQGGPLPTATSHTAGAKVMSTPLPIAPAGYVSVSDPPGGTDWSGRVTPMCIWDEVWTSVGAGLVHKTTSVFDIGDGWMAVD